MSEARDLIYINVGVTGHRVLGEHVKPRLREVLHEVLSEVRVAASGVYESKRLFFESIDGGAGVKTRVISSLAEGVDRMVAQEALGQGYELQVPLPFRQERYESTFEEGAEALQEFRALLQQATAVFCADFEAQESSKAYEDASKVMLSHSDVLIAVWNGKPNKYIAGTYPTIREALRMHVPIICISSENPDKVAYVQDSCERLDWKEALHERLGRVLLPADDLVDKPIHLTGIPFPAQQMPHHPKKDYDLNGLVERFMLKKDELRPLADPVLTPPFEADAEKMAQLKETGSRLWGEVKKTYSGLSGVYSGLFRNSMVLRILVPLLALMLLIGALNTDGWLEVVLYVLQVVMLVFVIWLVRREKSARTNRCFYGYRVLAERSRISTFLSVIGYSNANLTNSSYMEGGTRSEGVWYYRILQRERGLPNMTLDMEQTKAWLQWLRKEFLCSQLKYHYKRKEKSFVLQRRLGKLALVSFYGGLLATIVRACADSLDFASTMGYAGALALFLPSLATFWTSYSGNSGYSLHYAASSGMESKLRSLISDVDMLLSEYHGENKSFVLSKIGIGTLFKLSEQLEVCCMEELSDWEDSIQSRMLKLV